MSHNNGNKHKKIKIKNRPDYLLNNNMILNIKDIDPSLLKVYKLSYKGVFSHNICYIKYFSTKTLHRIDNGKDYLYLLLDGHTEENNGIEYLVFTPREKDKEALKNYKKLWEET